MLKAYVQGKRVKDHQEQKQVVDAESFFDQVAGKEFKARPWAAEIEHSKPKEHRNRDPSEAGEGRLANPDLVRPPVEDAQVQGDGNDDKEIERNPVKGRSHGSARRR